MERIAAKLIDFGNVSPGRLTGFLLNRDSRPRLLHVSESIFSHLLSPAFFVQQVPAQGIAPDWYIKFGALESA
jgi:hypothetical protein